MKRGHNFQVAFGGQKVAAMFKLRASELKVAQASRPYNCHFVGGTPALLYSLRLAAQIPLRRLDQFADAARITFGVTVAGQRVGATGRFD